MSPRPRAQEQNHIFGRGLVQAGLQGEDGVELGLVDQLQLDQQRAELAVVRGLPGERGVEPRAGHQAGTGEQLAEAQIRRSFVVAFRQSAAMIVARARAGEELCPTACEIMSSG
jgi:hypothetical protein